MNGQEEVGLALRIGDLVIQPELVAKVLEYTEAPKYAETELWGRQPIKHAVGVEAAKWGVELALRTPPYPLGTARKLAAQLKEYQSSGELQPVEYDGPRNGDYLITLEVTDRVWSAGFRAVELKVEFWGSTKPKDRTEPTITATNFESPWGSSFA